MESKNEKWIKVGMFVLISLYGLSAWIDVNGLFVELPIFVQVLPEGWNLPSYLIIIIQVANIAPFCYFIVRKLKPNWIRDWISSCVIIGIGIMAAFVLIFAWDKTSYIGGELHSTGLFTLSFFLALVDCTSSVVYLPYMARFKSRTFITALHVGEGFGSLIAALMGLAQGSGERGGINPTNLTMNETGFSNVTALNQPALRFSVSVFMAILTILLIISLISFVILHFHPAFDMFKFNENEVRTETKNLDCETRLHASTETVESGVIMEADDLDFKKDIEISDIQSKENKDQKNSSLENEGAQRNKNSIESIDSSSIKLESNTDTPLNGKRWKDVLSYIILYSTITWISALNFAFIPAIQSFACMPYGYLAYDLTAKLSVLINPLACFVTLCFTVKHLFLIIAINAIGTLMAAYIIFLASLSPEPILKDEAAGIVLVVLSNVILMALFSYLRVCISIIFSDRGQEKLLLYSGLFTQIGAFTGAVIGFLLVNVFKVFKQF